MKSNLTNFVFALCLTFLFINKSHGQCPTTPPSMKGPLAVCLHSTITYENKFNSPPLSWSLNGGGVFISGSIVSSPKVQWNTPGTWELKGTLLGCPSTSDVLLRVTVYNNTSNLPPSSISGSFSVCTGSSSTYSVPTVNGLTPVWSITPLLNTQDPSFTVSNGQATFNWSVPGTYKISVAYSNGGCVSTANEQVVKVSSGNEPISIVESTSECTSAFSVNGDYGSNIVWTLSNGGTIVSNGSRATVYWTSSGTHTVSVSTTNPCSGVAITTSKAVTVTSVGPSAPGMISKLNNATCQSASETFSTQPVANATSYEWTYEMNDGKFVFTTATPTHTMSFPTSRSGNVTVKASNGTCKSLPSIPFSIQIVPSTITILGPSYVCSNTEVQLTVSSSVDVSQYQYNWSVDNGIINGPTNGSTVKVQWINQIGQGPKFVSVSGPCGVFSSKMINITQNDHNFKIDGVTNACQGTYAYYISGSTSSGNISYVDWAVSPTSSITPGDFFGSHVTWATPGSYILTANITNNCGVTREVSLPVTVSSDTKPPTNLINGISNDVICTATLPVSKSYNVTATTGVNYRWEIRPDNSSTIESIGNLATVNWGKSGNNSVSVTPFRSSCDGEKTWLPTTVNEISLGTLSSSITTTCINNGNTTVPITLSLTSVKGTPSYRVRKKVDNGAWLTWSNFYSASYIENFTGLTINDLSESIYLEFQAFIAVQGCTEVSSNIVSVRINRSPRILEASQLNKSICTGQSVDVLPFANFPDVVYNWVSTLPAQITGISASGIGAISEVATNTGNSEASVIFNVTATKNGCASQASTFNRTIVPAPVVLDASKTICPNQSINYNIVPNISSNVVYSFPDPDGSGYLTGATNKDDINGADLDGNLSNDTSEPKTYVYQVTPSYRFSNLLCPGKTANISIVVNPLPKLTNTLSSTICSNQSVNLALTASVPSSVFWKSKMDVSGITGESLVEKNNNAIDDILVNSSSGPLDVEYQVTTKAIVGNCQSDNLIKVKVKPTPISSVTNSGATTFCEGNSVFLNADNSISGMVYQWSNNLNMIQGATTSSLKVTTSGSYTVKVNNSYNCPASSLPIVVSVNRMPLVNLQVDGYTTTCQGNALSITAPSEQGYSYQWFRNGTAVPNEFNRTINPQTSGNYWVSISLNGCTKSSSSIPVTILPTPASVISASGPTTFCSGSSVTLSGQLVSGNTYQWFVNGTTIPSATTHSLVVKTTGNYSLRVTNPSNCSTISNSINVIVNPIPEATINISGSTTFCSGNPITLSTPTGVGFSYQWFNSGNPISGATSSTHITNQSGSYTVEVKSSPTCSKTSNALAITSIQQPSAIISTPPTTTLCSGSSIVLNANVGTGLTYQWFREGAIVSGATQASYTVTQGGSYHVKVTSNGCTSSSNNINVIQAAPLTVSVIASSSLCEGSTVRLNSVVNGTTILSDSSTISSARYRFSWTTGATTPFITISSAGVYAVTVTDNLSGCTRVASSRVFAPIRPTISASGTLCSGYVTLTSSLGDTYRWSNGATTRSINVYNSGTYTVTTTNATGCPSATSAPYTVAACSDPRDPRILQQAITTNNNLDKSRILSVYPNKADKQFNVKFSQPLNEEARVIIYNQFGFPVKQGLLSKGITEELIESTNLTEGIYVIRVFTSEGLLTQKVIISH